MDGRLIRSLQAGAWAWFLLFAGIMQVFTKPGDKILIQTPVYSEFYDITEALGRQVLENQLVEQDGVWSIDFEDFEKKAEEAKVFLLCSPHNPLGNCMDQGTAEENGRYLYCQ